MNALIESYEQSGFGYVAYAVRPSVDPEEDAALETSGYGISYTSPDWLDARAGATVLEEHLSPRRCPWVESRA